MTTTTIRNRAGRWLDPVTIAGTSYWASVSTDPIGGTIQRKTNGDATKLIAWRKSRVTITGEGDPPAMADSVAIVSAVYTGSLLVIGVAVTRDQGSGLITWTLTGEQP